MGTIGLLGVTRKFSGVTRNPSVLPIGTTLMKPVATLNRMPLIFVAHSGSCGSCWDTVFVKQGVIYVHRLTGAHASCSKAKSSEGFIRECASLEACTVHCIIPVLHEALVRGLSLQGDG